MCAVGQPSDPYEDDDNSLGITISGLPTEPDEPEDVVEASPEEPGGDFDAEAVELADGDRVAVDGTGLDTEYSDASDEDDLDDEEESEGEGDDLGEEVAYDLTEWEDDQLSTLFDKLTEAGLDYLWDGEELFVRAEDEDVVDTVIERVSYPDQLAEEDDDGDAGANLLGDIFVAADRLQHDPEEHEAVAQLLTLADLADESTAPYGLSDEEWKHLHEKVEALADLLEADTIDIEAATEAAKDLRSVLRPYV
jgi:hypothetical protein